MALPTSIANVWLYENEAFCDHPIVARLAKVDGVLIGEIYRRKHGELSQTISVDSVEQFMTSANDWVTENHPEYSLLRAAPIHVALLSRSEQIKWPRYGFDIEPGLRFKEWTRRAYAILSTCPHEPQLLSQSSYDTKIGNLDTRISREIT